MSITYEVKEKVVVYHSTWVHSPSIGEVTRITPSGRIYVHIPGAYRDEIIFNPDGYERGSRGYNRTHLGKGTQELFDKIKKQKLIEKFQSFFRSSGSNTCQADKLPLKTLQEMWAQTT